MSNSVRLGDVATLLEQEALKAGLNPALAKSLLIAENSAAGEFNPDKLVPLSTTSPKGAYGVGQVMPATRDGLIRNGYLPAGFKDDTLQSQVQAMVAVMKEQTKYTGGDPVLAAAMYNGGFAAMNAVKSGNMAGLNPETTQYLKKVGVNMDGNDPTKVRTSVSSSGSGVPVAALQRVQDAGGVWEKTVSGILDSLRGLTGETQAAAGEAQGAVADMGAAKGTMALQRGEAVRAQEANRNELLQAMGVDMKKADSEIRALQGEAAIAQEEMRQLSPQLKELRNKSFMDDPLGWIMAQVQLEQSAAAYNTAQTRFTQAMGTIDQKQIQATRQFGLQPGVSVDAALLSAEAEAKAAAAEARVRSFEIGQTARNAQSAAFSTELRFADVQFENAKTMARIMSERFNITQAEVADKAEREDLTKINVFRNMIAAAPVSYDEFKRMDAKTRTEMIQEASRTSFTVADSPGQAMRLLYDRRTLAAFAKDLSPQAAVFLGELHQLGEKAASTLDPKNAKASPEDKYIKAINDKVLEWRKDAIESNNNTRDPNNPFRLHPHVAAQSPALKGNTIAQYVLSTADGGARLDDKAILQYGVAQVVSGAKTAEQAAEELQRFYWEGTKFQDQSYRMSLLGFDRRNPATGKIEYNVDRDMYGIFERTLTNATNPGANVRLFNKPSLVNFITYRAVQEKAAKPLINTSATIERGLEGLKTLQPLKAGPNITYP